MPDGTTHGMTRGSTHGIVGMPIRTTADGTTADGMTRGLHSDGMTRGSTDHIIIRYTSMAEVAAQPITDFMPERVTIGMYVQRQRQETEATI